MLIKSALKRITPPQILQLREYIRREKQARKSPRDIFSEIYSRKYWGGNDRDYFSGWGSHSQPLIDAYLAGLKPILESAPKVTLVDLGCGDFNIGRQVRPSCWSYIACDVVPDLIERNRIKFGDMDVDFRCLDILADELPPGDVALVKEVLQHLNTNQIARFLERARRYKVLVITEHLPAEAFTPNVDKPTGTGIRVHGLKRSGVDILASPFNFRCASHRVLAEVKSGNDVLRTTAYFN